MIYSQNNFNKTKTIQMKNLILTFALCFIVTLSFAQLKVVAPNGDTGIGISTPSEKLHVLGNTFIQNGDLIMNSGGSQNFLRGQGAQRFTLSTNSTSLNSRSFITMWGNESHSSNPAPGRIGELVFASSYLVVRTNKTGANFGSIAFQVKANGNTYASGDIYSNGNLITSDQRLKQGIKPLELGLDAIMQLEPKQYHYTGDAGTNKERLHTGVMAQDFQKVAPEGVVEVNYTDHENRINEDYLAIDEGMIKFMLINAVKEQQEMIKQLQEEVANLKGNTSEGTNQSFSNQKLVLSNLADAEISFVSPNPFKNSARIDFNLNRDFSTATLNVYNVDGKIVNSVQLTEKVGTIELDAKQLSKGLYNYSIVVDGEIIDTKKLIKE